MGESENRETESECVCKWERGWVVGASSFYKKRTLTLPTLTHACMLMYKHKQVDNWNDDLHQIAVPNMDKIMKHLPFQVRTLPYEKLLHIHTRTHKLESHSWYLETKHVPHMDTLQI